MMVFWYAVAAAAVGLLCIKQGLAKASAIAVVVFLAGIAGGALGGWL